MAARMHFTLVLICLILTVTSVPVDQVSNKTVEDTRLLFGEENLVRVSNQNVWHMEPDLYFESGHILFSWGSALKSTKHADHPNDLRNYDLAGSVDITGYQEGIGTRSRFNIISGFVQVDKETVIIADRYNACLRKFNRVSNQTSRFTGRCSVKGYADGDANTAYFSAIAGVLVDERTDRDIIVIDDDYYNNALRSVNINSGLTTTIIKDEQNLNRPRAAVFDNNDKNILYVTVRFQIVKVSLAEKSISLVSGKHIPFQYLDGSFDEALFGYWPAEMLMIDDNHLAVADRWNHDVRLFDLVNKEVTSFCQSEYNGTSVAGLGCDLQFPHGMMLLNDTLYVGDIANIHTFPVKSIPVGQKISNGQFRTDCAEQNITATIGNGEKRATVKVKGHVLYLSAGSHQYVYTDEKGLSCLVNIIVRGALGVCPHSLSRVASPDTKTAIVNLALGDIHQQFVLPVGQHPYSVSMGDVKCSFNINIFDSDMERTVEFELAYKFDCKSFNSNQLAQNIVNSMLDTNFDYILEICDSLCGRKPGSTPRATCAGNTMTVMYPTDLSYGGDVSAIPDDIKQTLNDRLWKRGTMMSLVDVTKVPPTKFPIKQANGASAKLVLTSSCLNQKTYDSSTNSCR